MTETPDPAAPHLARPAAPRAEPYRSWTGAVPPRPTPVPPPPPSHVGEDGVSEIVAHTVRVGYEVIAENLAQGRIAADRYGAGHYRVEDASHDLTTVGKRLLQLSRDLSATGFDLIGAVLADPALRTAVASHGTPTPPSPTPPPTPPHMPPPPPPASGIVEVAIAFAGPGAARGAATPTTLRQPTTPSILKIADLGTTVTAAAPLKATIGLSPGRGGLVVTVTIPDGQPAGQYSGFVTALAGDMLGVVGVVVGA